MSPLGSSTTNDILFYLYIQLLFFLNSYFLFFNSYQQIGFDKNENKMQPGRFPLIRVVAHETFLDVVHGIVKLHFRWRGRMQSDVIFLSDRCWMQPLKRLSAAKFLPKMKSNPSQCIFSTKTDQYPLNVSLPHNYEYLLRY